MHSHCIKGKGTIEIVCRLNDHIIEIIPDTQQLQDEELQVSANNVLAKIERENSKHHKY